MLNKTMYLFFYQKSILVFFLNLLFQTAKPATVYGISSCWFSQYCYLGVQTNGINNFACITPIAQVGVIRAGLVLTEHSKNTNELIKFKSSVSYIGTTVSSFNIVLDLQQSASIKISFVLLIIKSQPTTKYVDIGFFFSDVGSSIDNNNNVGRILSLYKPISPDTIFTSASSLTFIPFTSYFAILSPLNSSSQPDPSTDLKFTLTASASTPTQVKLDISVLALTSVNYFGCWVIIYDSSAINSNSAMGYRHQDFQISTTTSNSFSLLAWRWRFGPSWNGKCLLGIRALKYTGSSIFTYEYSRTSYGTFQTLDQIVGSTLTYMAGTNFCIGQGIQCVQSTAYWDSFTNSCNTPENCPLPVPVGWNDTKNCPLCNQMICITCSSADRSICTNCGPNSYADSFSNLCICDPGYISVNFPISNTSGLWNGQNGSLIQCVYINCSLAITGCLQNNCINATFCTDCDNGSYLNLQNNSTQICTLCNLTLSIQCTQCTDSANCTVCLAGFYLQNILDIFGIVTGKDCSNCSVSMPNCGNCSNNLTCDGCLSGYLWNGTACLCDLSVISLTFCLACTVAFECDSCQTGFYVNTTTLQCWGCNNLDVNCTQCSDQNTCTLCNPGLGTDPTLVISKVKCSLCSILISNCQLCQNSSYCSDCAINFGVNTSFQCQNCSILVGPGCISCQNSTGCLLCSNDSFLINGSCFFCQAIHYKCDTCVIDSSGLNLDCIICKIGFYLNILSTSPSLLTQCKTCQSVTPYCQECSPDGSYCTKCSLPFLLGATGLCNQCASGYVFIDPFCVKLGGCQTSIIINGIDICLSCASPLNFVYDPKNKKCICGNGFIQIKKLNQPRYCQSVCGDGITISKYQQCDDNNLLDNDGCSSLCKAQQDYQCSISSPSQCVLYLTQFSIQYSYSYRVEAQNKGIIYFKILSSHSHLQSLKWSQLLDFTFLPHQVHAAVTIQNLKFDPDSGMLALTVDFKLDLQEQFLRTILKFNDNYFILTLPDGSKASTNIQLQSKLIGINSPLIIQDASILDTFKKVTTLSIIIICLLFLLFYLSTCWHKMIGLETINVIQTLYFARMVAPSQSTSLLNSFNLIQYSATGYSSSQFLFGSSVQSIQQKAYTDTSKQFVSISLDKYFLLNVNFDLLLVIVIIIAYGITFFRKIYHRSKYMQTKEQQEKDLYVKCSRQSQFAYGNWLFPNTMMLNMVCFFNAILYLQSSQSSDQNLNANTRTIQTQSFFIFIVMLMINFFIYAYQIFVSYEQYLRFNMTPEERDKIPESTIQKLQHDQNSPYRPNYHPLYVLIYLIFYFLIQLSIVIGVLIDNLKYGLQIVLALNITYFVFICIYSPYQNSISIHNHFLKLNHFTVVLFLIICEIISKFQQLPSQTYIILTYIIVALMGLVILGGFIRLFMEKKFRQNISNQTIQGNNKKQNKTMEEQISKKQLLLRNNPYLFKAPLRSESLTFKFSQIQSIKQNNLYNNFFNQQNKIQQDENQVFNYRQNMQKNMQKNKNKKQTLLEFKVQDQVLKNVKIKKQELMKSMRRKLNE